MARAEPQGNELMDELQARILTRRRTPRSERGFVLAVVLVLMVTLTLLVIAQVRRGAVGQTLAVNSSQYTLAESAAQSVLRYCEAAMMQSVGQADSVRVTTPGVRGTDAAAWQTAAKWTNSEVSFATGTGAVAFPGVAAYSCLFEDATAELVPSVVATDANAESGGGSLLCEVRPGVSPRMCKYRVTARVTLTLGRQLHLQSEVRFAI